MKKNLPETGKKATGMTASVDQPLLNETACLFLINLLINPTSPCI